MPQGPFSPEPDGVELLGISGEKFEKKEKSKDEKITELEDEIKDLKQRIVVLEEHQRRLSNEHLRFSGSRENVWELPLRGDFSW